MIFAPNKEATLSLLHPQTGTEIKMPTLLDYGHISLFSISDLVEAKFKKKNILLKPITDDTAQKYKT